MSDDLMDVLRGVPFRERVDRIRTGLRAPAGSPERKYAIFLLLRVFGPSTVSIASSVGLVLMLVVFGFSSQVAPNREVAVEVMTADQTKIDDLKLDDIKPEVRETTDQTQDQIAFDTPNAPNTVGVPTEGDNSTEPASLDLTPMLTRSPLVMKNIYGARSKHGRAGALAKFKGSVKGEKAVNKALEWLKNHQDPDGSWVTAERGDVCRTRAMCGLAILTFLAHGETPASTDYGPTVEKAIKYLLAGQAPDGSFVGTAKSSSPGPYAHAICTYAICEAFAMTKIVALKDAMEKAVAVIIDGQQPQGGFNYGYSKGDRFDMSVAAWQFQALKAAKMAGSTNPKLEDAIKLCIQFMKTQAYTPTGGGFVYQGKPGIQANGGASPSMTAAGVLGLQLLGQPNAPEVKAGLKTLENLAIRWEITPDTKGADGKVVKGKKALVYTWYYATQAKFQAGGATWDAWNAVFSKELTAAQQEDGHWDNGDHGGAVYTTCLCALTLQVYYRYLPTYQVVKESAPEKSAISDENVDIKITPSG